MFYDRFIVLCKNRNVSPSRVAIECDFNKGSVSVWKKKYEIGKDVMPTAEILKKIADYFNVSVDYLLGTEQKEKPIDYKANEQMYELWNKYIKLSKSDKKTIDDMFDFLLSKPEYIKKENVG